MSQEHADYVSRDFRRTDYSAPRVGDELITLDARRGRIERVIHSPTGEFSFLVEGIEKLIPGDQVWAFTRRIGVEP